MNVMNGVSKTFIAVGAVCIALLLGSFVIDVLDSTASDVDQENIARQDQSNDAYQTSTPAPEPEPVTIPEPIPEPEPTPAPIPEPEQEPVQGSGSDQSETENNTEINPDQQEQNSDNSLMEEESDQDTSDSSPDPEQEPQRYTIVYSDTGFRPSGLEIMQGDTVIFVNESSRGMWVASDPHPSHSDLPGFDQMSSGFEYEYTFDQTGTFGYHNHVFSTHGAQIVVQSNEQHNSESETSQP